MSISCFSQRTFPSKIEIENKTYVVIEIDQMIKINQNYLYTTYLETNVDLMIEAMQFKDSINHEKDVIINKLTNITKEDFEALKQAKNIELDLREDLRKSRSNFKLGIIGGAAVTLLTVILLK